MPRSLTSFSLSLVAFFTTIAVGTANAKECKTDSECGTGFECILATTTGEGTGGNTGSTVGNGGAGGAACAGPDCPVSTSMPVPPTPVDGGAAPAIDLPLPVDAGVRRPTPTPTTDAGLTTPVVTIGYCHVKTLVCTSKADCPANLDCVKHSVLTPQPPCAPNTTCDIPLRTGEVGACKAVCNVDSDCPAPLACKLEGQVCMGGSSKSSDGTVTTIPETCSGGNKICSYQPVTCSADSECSANYQCAKVAEHQSCTGSGSTGCAKPRGDADVVCTPTPSEPPVCTTVVVNNCLPKQIACDAGQACPAGWTCFDFANFDSTTIPGWNGTAYGKSCLPDGIIMGLYGYASGGGGRNTAGYGSGEASASDPGQGGSSGTIDLGKGGNSGTPVSTGGDSTPPQTGPVPASDGQEHAVGGDAGIVATPKVRDGGCSLAGGQGGSSAPWLTLGLAGLVLRLVRRRK